MDRAESTICNVRRTLPLTAGGLGVAVGPAQSPASLEKDLNGLKEEDTCRKAQRQDSSLPHIRYCLIYESEDD